MLKRTCTVCGGIHKANEECPKAKSRHKEYNEYHRNSEAMGFYNSRAWKKMALMIKERDHGLDQYELIVNKKLVRGELVHHIIPLEEDPDRRLNPRNLIYVSRKSHKKIHDTYEEGENAKETLQNTLFNAIKNVGHPPG